MFHRQSQGYGLGYLNTLCADDYQRIMDDGIVTISDKDKVKVVLPLPNYYKRKLFYNHVKLNDDTVQWQPTNLGKQYITNSLNRNITNLSKRYSNILLNCTDDEYNTFMQLLGSRSLQDLALYNLLYRSRSRSTSYFGKDIQPREADLNQWLDTILVGQCYSDEDIHFYDRDTDNNTISIPTDYGNLFKEYISRKTQDYGTYIQQNTFNEHSSPYFANFDKLNALLSSITSQDRKNKQSTFDFIESQSKIYRSHFNNHGTVQNIPRKA